MKAYDYFAVVYGGEVFCTECVPQGVNPSGDDCYPIFADSEWSYYPECVVCGREHDYITLIERG
jgi:hypothetical protein